VGSDKFKFLSAVNIGDVRLKSENFFIYVGGVLGVRPIELDLVS